MKRSALFFLPALLLGLAGEPGLRGDVPRPRAEPPVPARGKIIGKVMCRQPGAGWRPLANVVVWVRPEGDRAFNLEPDDLDPVKGGWQRQVVVKASAKALVPEVVVLFPAYRKPGRKKPIRTGQTFAVDNCDREVHAVSAGTECKLLEPLTLTRYELWPDRIPISMSCCIHRGMRAYVWAFDHPFAAVTNAQGEYQIPNVPAGVPLRIQAWRPETGWLARHGKAGDPINVSVGQPRECSFALDLPRK